MGHADNPLEGIEVTGPVRAEVFMVWLNRDRIEIAGPDGARAWIVQLDEVEHPVEAVDRIVRGLIGAPSSSIRPRGGGMARR